MATKKITLTSNDGTLVTVDRKIAERSVLIKNMLEEMWDEWLEVDDKTVVPIPNVSGSVLKKVIEWCEHHENGSTATADDDSYSLKTTTDIDEWDRKFMQVDREILIVPSRAAFRSGTDVKLPGQDERLKHHPLAGMQSMLSRVGDLANKRVIPLLVVNFVELANASDTTADKVVPITLSSTSPEGWPFPLAALVIVGALRGTTWCMYSPTARAKELLLFDGVCMGLTGLLHLMVIGDKPRTPVVYWTTAIISAMFFSAFSYKDFLARDVERYEHRERNVGGQGEHRNQERPGDHRRESRWHSSTACPLLIAGTALLIDVVFTAVRQPGIAATTTDQYTFLNIVLPCLVASSGFWSFVFRLISS